MQLKQIRIKKGLTQQQVADGINCSTNVYSRYERGEREPSIEILIKLSEFLDMPIDYIVGNKDTGMSTFTKYELDLIYASRKADDRAKKDALLILQANKLS